MHDKWAFFRGAVGGALGSAAGAYAGSQYWDDQPAAGAFAGGVMGGLGGYLTEHTARGLWDRFRPLSTTENHLAAVASAKKFLKQNYGADVAELEAAAEKTLSPRGQEVLGRAIKQLEVDRGLSSFYDAKREGDFKYVSTRPPSANPSTSPKTSTPPTDFSSSRVKLEPDPSPSVRPASKSEPRVSSHPEPTLQQPRSQTPPPAKASVDTSVFPPKSQSGVSSPSHPDVSSAPKHPPTAHTPLESSTESMTSAFKSNLNKSPVRVEQRTNLPRPKGDDYFGTSSPREFLEEQAKAAPVSAAVHQSPAKPSSPSSAPEAPKKPSSYERLSNLPTETPENLSRIVDRSWKGRKETAADPIVKDLTQRQTALHNEVTRLRDETAAGMYPTPRQVHRIERQAENLKKDSRRAAGQHQQDIYIPGLHLGDKDTSGFWDLNNSPVLQRIIHKNINPENVPHAYEGGLLPGQESKTTARKILEDLSLAPVRSDNMRFNASVPDATLRTPKGRGVYGSNNALNEESRFATRIDEIIPKNMSADERALLTAKLEQAHLSDLSPEKAEKVIRDLLEKNKGATYQYNGRDLPYDRTAAVWQAGHSDALQGRKGMLPSNDAVRELIAGRGGHNLTEQEKQVLQKYLESDHRSAVNATQLAEEIGAPPATRNYLIDDQGMSPSFSFGKGQSPMFGQPAFPEIRVGFSPAQKRSGPIGAQKRVKSEKTAAAQPFLDLDRILYNFVSMAQAT